MSKRAVRDLFPGEIRPAVADVIVQLDVASTRIRAAIAALNKQWCRGGNTLAEIRAMRAAGRRARSATR